MSRQVSGGADGRLVDLVVDVAFELLEVLLEALGDVARGAVVGLLVFQVFFGFSTSPGTSGQALGTCMPMCGSVDEETEASVPSSAARTIARVWRIDMRSTTPKPPPDQPVLTSQHFTFWRAIFSPSILA